MWIIKQIAEADYGCEERINEKEKCLVILENETGIQTQIEIEDEWLRNHNLDEGSIWQEINLIEEEEIMEFGKYMNPPNIENLPEQIEEEVAKKKKYKDVIVGFERDTQKLTVDVYWGKANYAVYTFDGNQYSANKMNVAEIYPAIEKYEDKEDKRILKILDTNYFWAQKYYLGKA